MKMEQVSGRESGNKQKQTNDRLFGKNKENHVDYGFVHAIMCVRNNN